MGLSKKPVGRGEISERVFPKAEKLPLVAHWVQDNASPPPRPPGPPPPQPAGRRGLEKKARANEKMISLQEDLISGGETSVARKVLKAIKKQLQQQRQALQGLRKKREKVEDGDPNPIQLAPRILSGPVL